MDPLLREEVGQAITGVNMNTPDATEGDRAGFSCLTALGFAFLTFNSGMALYRSEGDGVSIAFVVFSYLDLVLLFIYLRAYDRRGGRRSNSARIWVVRAAVWVLSTLLTALFAWKVASVMPLAVAMLVWLMTVTGVVGGFYAFFLHGGA